MVSCVVLTEGLSISIPAMKVTVALASQFWLIKLRYGVRGSESIRIK